MLVAQIVKAKPSLEIHTIAPHAKVREAVSLLAEKKIGALVVSSDGASIAGILSERDIVRAIASEGAGVLDGAVSRLMTVRIETCSPKDRLREVAEWMTKGRFRHMQSSMAGIWWRLSRSEMWSSGVLRSLGCNAMRWKR